MKAVEFESQTHDGVIDLPPQYQTWNNMQVKVILLVDDQIVDKKKLSKTKFSAISINTKDYHFNREEANER